MNPRWLSMRPDQYPPQKVDTTWIGSGDSATYTTLGVMRQMLDAAAQTYTVRAKAEAITRDCASYDDACVVHRLYNFVHRRVRYRLDPQGIELVKTPEATLREIDSHGTTGGDCDDSAVLLAALLQSLGYAVRFVALAERTGALLHHVVLEVAVGGSWIKLDPIVPGGAWVDGIGGRLNAARRVTA